MFISLVMFTLFFTYYFQTFIHYSYFVYSKIHQFVFNLKYTSPKRHLSYHHGTDFSSSEEHNNAPLSTIIYKSIRTSTYHYDTDFSSSKKHNNVLLRARIHKSKKYLSMVLTFRAQKTITVHLLLP